VSSQVRDDKLRKVRDLPKVFEEMWDTIGAEVIRIDGDELRGRVRLASILFKLANDRDLDYADLRNEGLRHFWCAA